MSEVITGLVKRVSSKEAGARRNLVYNLCILCDDNGEEEWFGHGFDKPICFEGDAVEFEVEYKGKYANIVKGSVTVTQEGERQSRGNDRGTSRGGRGRGDNRSAGREERNASSGRGAARQAPKSGGMSKDDYWNKKAETDKERDLIIQLQSAQNTAVATVSAAITAGALALPTKKGDKYDAFIAAVDEEAMRLRKVYLKGGHDTTAPEEQEEEQEQEGYDYDDDDQIPE